MSAAQNKDSTLVMPAGKSTGLEGQLSTNPTCDPGPAGERAARAAGAAGLTQLAEQQGDTAAADGQRVGEWGLDDLPVTGPQRDGSLWKERGQCSAAPTRPVSAQSSRSGGETGQDRPHNRRERPRPASRPEHCCRENSGPLTWGKVGPGWAEETKNPYHSILNRVQLHRTDRQRNTVRRTYTWGH